VGRPRERLARWPVSLQVNDGLMTPPGVAAAGPPRPAEWEALRRDNTAYLQPWDPTSPSGATTRVGYAQYLRGMARDARAGTLLPLAIEVEGRLAGQVHVFGSGAGRCCRDRSAIGWGERCRPGITTRALAAVCDYALGPLGLHRVEVNIRPENAASLAVVAHLRFREEGVRERYMHIAGAWRDHRSFALTTEELAGHRSSSGGGATPSWDDRVALRADVGDGGHLTPVTAASGATHRKPGPPTARARVLTVERCSLRP
jgi:ribosomal-protein-alanine N-acetyltransferase